MRGGLLGQSTRKKGSNALKDLGKGGPGSHLPSVPQMGRVGPLGECPGDGGAAGASFQARQSWSLAPLR